MIHGHKFYEYQLLSFFHHFCTCVIGTISNKRLILRCLIRGRCLFEGQYSDKYCISKLENSLKFSAGLVKVITIFFRFLLFHGIFCPMKYSINTKQGKRTIKKRLNKKSFTVKPRCENKYIL